MKKEAKPIAPRLIEKYAFLSAFINKAKTGEVLAFRTEYEGNTFFLTRMNVFQYLQNFAISWIRIDVLQVKRCYKSCNQHCVRNQFLKTGMTLL